MPEWLGSWTGMSQQVGSGIAPLDERINGLVPRRCYVVSGAPGTGKTAACLAFVQAALLANEHAVVVTQDDPTDLLGEARYLGMDIERALADERLVLLRYQLDFVRRLARAASPEIAFDELDRLIGAARPSRIVIDSVAPFLEAGTASGAGIHALLAFLDRLGATSIVTYPADLAGLYDRRLEPLVQRAAAIFHFARDSERGLRIEIRKVRYAVPSTAPVHFAIRAGEGIVGIVDSQRRRAGDVRAEVSQKLVVIDTARAFPDELVAALRASYQLTLRHTLPSAFADLAAPSGAVLIEVRRDTVNDALTLVRELRRGGNCSPIVLVTQFNLRADDRARALRAGADDFLSGDLHPVEFLVRIQGIIDRGHVARSVPDDTPLVMQPRGADGAQLLDAHDFRDAVNSRLAGETAAFFTLVLLRPERAAQMGKLASLVLGALRVEGGDLAGKLDGAVAVYLHAARRKDVAPFVERIREQWLALDEGEFTTDVAPYPVKKERVIDLLSSTPGEGSAAVPHVVPRRSGGSLGDDARTA
jgi:KaiC/GvpD/RAD55 family RecA-like ATPase/DNA-binding response OmpR family regulator